MRNGNLCVTVSHIITSIRTSMFTVCFHFILYGECIACGELVHSTAIERKTKRRYAHFHFSPFSFIRHFIFCCIRSSYTVSRAFGVLCKIANMYVWPNYHFNLFICVLFSAFFSFKIWMCVPFELFGCGSQCRSDPISFYL